MGIIKQLRQEEDMMAALGFMLVLVVNFNIKVYIFRALLILFGLNVIYATIKAFL